MKFRYVLFQSFFAARSKVIQFGDVTRVCTHSSYGASTGRIISRSTQFRSSLSSVVSNPSLIKTKACDSWPCPPPRSWARFLWHRGYSNACYVDIPFEIPYLGAYPPFRIRHLAFFLKLVNPLVAFGGVYPLHRSRLASRRKGVLGAACHRSYPLLLQYGTRTWGSVRIFTMAPTATMIAYITICNNPPILLLLFLSLWYSRFPQSAICIIASGGESRTTTGSRHGSGIRYSAPSAIAWKFYARTSIGTKHRAARVNRTHTLISTRAQSSVCV